MRHERREFLKTAALGVAGMALAPFGRIRTAAGAVPPAGDSQVSFARGGDRRMLIRQVLQPLEESIRAGIGDRQVIIKPNCVWDDNPLCASDVAAIRGVLDFLKPFHRKTVLIAESTASPNGTMKAFADYGYTGLAREYDVQLVDLNLQSHSQQWILGADRHPLGIQIIDAFMDPRNYIISLARLKTHNSVVCTLALKNMLMASPVNVPHRDPAFVVNQHQKRKMHEGGADGINFNLYLMAHKVRPALAVIDGFVGMEGNGPRSGTPVEHGIALAGLDVIAVDRIGLALMGINYAEVGYLQWCSAAGLGTGQIERIEVLGGPWRPYVRRYRLSDNIGTQLEWLRPKDV